MKMAFHFLEKAYAEHSFHVVNLIVSRFKPARSERRFQDLVQRLVLPGESASAACPT
jgi:hypothetical protein